MSDLYELDFVEWTRCNAALLRAGCFGQADIEHIVEELEDMGRSERRALQSRLEVLLLHLLKWQAQPERREHSTWRATIKVQRAKLHGLLEDMPSLRRQIPERLPQAYKIAIFKASGHTRLPETAFPEMCPFSIEQILDEDFFPE